MPHAAPMDWNDGEKEMQRKMHVPSGYDNPTVSALSQQLAMMLQRGHLLAIGTVDKQGRPWTSIWGGQPGFTAPLGGNLMGVRQMVDGQYDPVVEALVGGNADGEVKKEEQPGRMVAGLSLHLETRKRVKLYGRLIAGCRSKVDVADEDVQGTEGVREPDGTKKEKMTAEMVQLVVQIEQSLGNCPKYFNKKDLRPIVPSPKLISESIKLGPEALALLNRLDMFFISSAAGDKDMDTNHRGGPPGFVRIMSNEEDGAVIVYPEYSGNRLYQTLGNLKFKPQAGMCFPDYETGEVLYVTGKTEVLFGETAAAVLPQSNLALKLKITAARFVQNGLSFRGSLGEYSPYNPNLRLLTSEGNMASKLQQTSNHARLVSRQRVSPDIFRYRFALEEPVRYQPGQWVALDLHSELDIGYRHMANDDPRSLNDDYIRTFTVSSTPNKADQPPDDHFEITARTVGKVTHFLTTRRADGISIPIRGFGGEFNVGEETQKGELIPFVAGGVGITPLLGQLAGLDPKRMRLLWTLRLDDIDLVLDTFSRYPGLAAVTSIFFTGSRSDRSEEFRQKLERLMKEGAKVELRRLQKEDLDGVKSNTWHSCAGTGLQKQLLAWLPGKKVVYESFNF
ncbi:hypothetical protein NA57DRAFT_66633 [Rhizodiscina lignyota]|uniref:FAD-binding FR-type domain-containing protein n=1 Tax=Rhizodiscina lignyota TaxID=1504668 RepID=A0A9P4IHF8_9PEZI|nr:hypothetical protein NA57DRAFT_66633 [Rhizodiscina lignyota]